MKKDLILEIYSRSKTVFQIEELAQLFPEISSGNLRRRLHYFVKAGKLANPRRGIYAKNRYEPLELANKIYAPSYISFETVLLKEGIVFQHYETIFVASYLSRDLIVDGHKISYRQIGESALSNKSGIEEKGGYFIATKERAFLDAVFLYKDYYFDNLSGLNWKRVFELVPVYKSKAFASRVNSIINITRRNMVLRKDLHRINFIKILRAIYSDPQLRTVLGFKGGSAALLFYDLPRFSVDLDFDLLEPDKKEMVFEKLKAMLEEIGILFEAIEKRYTLFYLLHYQKGERTIKIEISKRPNRSQFEVKNYLGISMLVMKKEDMAANKLAALLTRREFAMRDVFDLWFFFKNNWPVNEVVLKERTGLSLGKVLEKAIKQVSGLKANQFLHGLGELLDEKQKAWVKTKLKEETVFYLRLYRETHGI